MHITHQGRGTKPRQVHIEFFLGRMTMSYSLAACEYR